MANVAHSTITDPNIHEPKGVATANDGEVYIANGSASGAWGKKETFGAFNGINTQTGNYVLVLTDQGKLIEMNVGSANTVTIPPNASVAFPTNTRIDIVQYGAGTTSLVAGSGVTIRSKDGALEVGGQYGGFSIYKRGTNEWVAVGDLTL